MVVKWLRIFKSGKAMAAAVISALVTAFPFLFALLATKRGHTLGNSILIAWSMYWSYVVVTIAVILVLAYAQHSRDAIGRLYSRLRLSVTDLWFSQDRKTLGRAVVSTSMLISAVFLLSAMSNLVFIAREEGRYLLRLASTDFKNRNLISAREYYESYRLPEAAEIYEAVLADYDSPVAESRLETIERRYRLHRILSEWSLSREERFGLTPETASTRVLASALYPYENAEITQQYLRRHEAEVALFRQAFKNCSAPQRAADPIIDHAARIFLEPQMYDRLRGNGFVRGWFCEAAKGPSISEATIGELWRAEEFSRLAELQKLSQNAGVICSAVDDEEAKNEEEQGKAEVHSYAAKLYSCGGDGKHESWFGSLVPWLHTARAPSEDAEKIAN
jgi:hypothetical protein